jgi:hypothetical protein
MGQDEKALIRLWQEKRGEVGPEGPVGRTHRPARLGDRGPQSARYERNTGCAITDVQSRILHPAIRWMAGHPRWRGDRDRGGLRGQVHAALVVLGGVRRREVHGSAPAQHVGQQRGDERCTGRVNRSPAWRQRSPRHNMALTNRR